MYVVKYSGPFGFIKPWTAVRDGETYSQFFLTPSIVEGIRQKLEVSKILRHRLSYSKIDKQQESTQPRGYCFSKKNKIYSRPKSILIRGVLIDPKLFLAFENYEDAKKASEQHICLARNEDVLLPDSNILEIDEQEFDTIDGFELMFEKNNESFVVGYNRFSTGTPEPMYGWLKVIGNPIKTFEEQ